MTVFIWILSLIYYILAFMIVLSVKNLTLSFGANDIFRDVSFELKQKERLGLYRLQRKRQDFDA